MSFAFAFDLLLAAALLWCGWRSLSVDRLDRAIVLFIAFGLLMALAWARYAGDDRPRHPIGQTCQTSEPPR